MKFQALVPMLHTQDIAGTRRWYEEVLGFQCTTSQGEDWCRLVRDGVPITFMRNAYWDTPNATATQYFYVDDVMALWASIQNRCTAEWGPETMPYGVIEVAIKDPNGYLLSFGQEI